MFCHSFSLSPFLPGDISADPLLQDLVTFCENESVPFTTFENFHDILETVKAIHEGKLSVKEAATGRK